MAGEMKALGQDVALGRKSLFAMALVVGVAVLREGAEVVLFLYGIAASGHDGWAALMLGGAWAWRSARWCPTCSTAAWSPSRWPGCSPSPGG